METNLVLRVEDLTPDFAEGMRKLFPNATLQIRVEAAGSTSGTSTASTGKRRGRPAKAATSQEGSINIPKKRGRKPGTKLDRSTNTTGPKKRGRKPKAATTA